MAHVRLPFVLALFAAVVAGAHEKHSTDVVGVLGLDVYAASSGDVVDALLAVQEPGAKAVELRHTRSRDGGATWSRPAPILPGKASVFSPRRGAEPQIAASGDRVVVIWTEPGTSPWGSGPLASAVSADGGKSWKKAAGPADDGTTKDHGFVDVAAVGPGAFLAVWLDGRDGGQGLRSAASKDGGATWGRNVDVERRTCECCANRLLVRDGRRRRHLPRAGPARHERGANDRRRLFLDQARRRGALRLGVRRLPRSGRGSRLDGRERT